MSVEYRYTEIEQHRIYSLHDGHGAHVVLLHGFSGSSSWWRHNLPAFCRHFSTSAPDLVGFGKSRGGRQPNIAEMSTLVVHWMRTNGIERAHIIGHSMGGQVAIHIAADHPAAVDKLVLVSAAGTPRTISIAQATRFLSEIIPPRAWGSPRFLPTIARDALRAGPGTLLRAAAHLIRDDVRPLLSRIQAQTLLVWGTLDALTPLRDGESMARAIANAELHVYDDAAHMPMVDQAAKFNRDVVEFLLR